MASRLLLERLTPLERAVFVLRGVCGCGFSEVAAAVGRSEAACRQLAMRARRHMDAGRLRFTADRAERETLADRLFAALQDGDVAGLSTVLTAGVQPPGRFAPRGPGAGRVTARRSGSSIRKATTSELEVDLMEHPFGAALEAGDIDAAASMLADHVTLHSPVAHRPYSGRAAVTAVLKAVSRVFEDFRYVQEIGAAGSTSHALVFRARIGDRDVEGCDFVHCTTAGTVDELMVMVRPLSAAHALAEAMKRELTSAT